jgi:O-antigen/teichoic acid export membrane protein
MIRRNILANIIARAWGVISVYLFVPIYLRFLGIEAYGIVGFYSTLLAVLAFADMGFTATLNREMARLSVRNDSVVEMADLLRTYESTYLCISSALAIIVWVLSPAIAAYWLRSGVLQPSEMTAAIRLMGVAIALQLPSALYIGGLMGLQKQVRANSVTIATGAFRGIGAVFVLSLISPTIFAFAMWQLVSNVIYCLAARQSLWHALALGAVRIQPHFRWQVFRNTWRYAAGMAGMAAISAVLTQADKLTVSKMLPLEMLGYYTLGSALASAPLMLASPIALAVFPRLTAMVASNDPIGLTRFYHRTCALVAVATIPAGVTLAFFAGDFIRAWTGSALAGQRTGTAASFLLGGQLLQALQAVPCYVALAYGHVRLNVYVNVASFLMIAPLLLVLVMRYGIVGAGLSWFVMTICTMAPFMYLLHRRFLPGELWKWLWCGATRPLLATLPIVLVARLYFPVPSSRLLILAMIGLCWSISAVATGATNSEIRMELAGLTGSLFRGFNAHA